MRQRLRLRRLVGLVSSRDGVLVVVPVLWANKVGRRRFVLSLPSPVFVFVVGVSSKASPGAHTAYTQPPNVYGRSSVVRPRFPRRHHRPRFDATYCKSKYSTCIAERHHTGRRTPTESRRLIGDCSPKLLNQDDTLLIARRSNDAHAMQRQIPNKRTQGLVVQYVLFPKGPKDA